MRILALVPARGGSKRLPGKNIRPLGGKPLILWSIESARKLPEMCDTLVSTDSESIAEVARTGGALVPWLRPASLSTDEASSVDVCLHALDWYEQEKGVVDGLLLLQATSPFRRPATLRRGVELFRAGAGRGVMGVSPAASHPLWCFKIDGQTLRPFCGTGGLQLRSQDLPPAFTVNGAFYLVTPTALRSRQSFFDDNTIPLVMDDRAESVDIDTEWDWQMALGALAAFESDAT